MADDMGPVGGQGSGLSLRRIPINNDLDIVAARVEGRNLAREIGFGIIDQARIATAISELARNVVLYAHGGEIVLSRLEANGARLGEEESRPESVLAVGLGLEIVCRDCGPGIPNVEEMLNQQAVGGQHTGPGSVEPAIESSVAVGGSEGQDIAAGGSQGMGLSGTRRLMDEFEITSAVGVGTTVVARRWLREPAAGGAAIGVGRSSS